MTLSTSSVESGTPITHARLGGQNGAAGVERRVPVRRLDSLLPRPDLPAPHYLKIDVDGAEAAILRGAAGMLASCSVIEVEATIADFGPRVALILSAGFQLFDIVEPCYYDGRLAEVDLIFLNERIISEAGLGLFQNGFDIARWEAYRAYSGAHS